MNSLIAQALKRQQDRPDIHKKVIKPKGRSGHPQHVIDMVLDLRDHVPGLSARQISTLTCVGRAQVAAFLNNIQPEERWTADDNEASAAAELAALCEHHGTREYEDHEGAATEYDPVPVHFTAPRYPDIHRRADQSHTSKRAITLPTFPFIPLATRYAA